MTNRPSVVDDEDRRIGCLVTGGDQRREDPHHRAGRHHRNDRVVLREACLEPFGCGRAVDHRHPSRQGVGDALRQPLSRERDRNDAHRNDAQGRA